MLNLAQPIDTSDPLLVSDDERTTILAPAPQLEPWRCNYELPNVNVLFSSDVRQWARKVRDADMRFRVNGPRQSAA